MHKFVFTGIIFIALVSAKVTLAHGEAAIGPAVLRTESFEHYIDSFNADDQELYPGYITNGAAWEFLQERVPLFECPEEAIQATYYFRWWTYRKHIKRTPEGFIITEFLPDVPWAGKDGSISCAAGHHFYEGRWLADPKYLDDYSLFWFRKGGDPRQYSFWAADSLWARYEVTGDDHLIKELLPDLIDNYQAWERDHRDTDGLFWQTDDRDGMEVSIGGSGYRPTINSYLYGEAMAIARIAHLMGHESVAFEFSAKAAQIKDLVQHSLWDTNALFYKDLPRGPNAHLADVREELGYTPWYFEMPGFDNSMAWHQIMDTNGFYAPFGPTTAERRCPSFQNAYAGHECQWNGPSWPYSTSITLTAMANLLHDYEQDAVTKSDYLDLLQIYAKSQHRRLADGRTVSWIDENLNPTNGDWIARTLLAQRGSEIPERGKDYNHSTYCDLVISGLVGLRPRADQNVEVYPLTPLAWNYFCLDHVRYHGHWLTIGWDKSGERYHHGQGLFVLVDGIKIGSSPTLKRLIAPLPTTSN